MGINWGAVADGMMKGYMQGRQLQQMDAQQKRLEMQDERAMRADERANELHTAQMVRIDREDQLAASRKQMEDEIRKQGALQMRTEYVPGKKEGEQVPEYVVGDKRFSNTAQAEQFLQQQNSPLMSARRQWEYATRLGDSTLAKQYGDMYNNTRTSVEADMRQAFAEAARQGPQAVAKLYNDRVADGTSLTLQPVEGGGWRAVRYQGGKMVGQPQMFKSDAEFMADAAARYKGDPDSLINYWQQERAFAEGVRRDDRDYTLRQEQLGIQRTGANASVISAEAARDRVQLERENQDKPVVVQATTADGRTNLGIINPRQKGATVVPAGSLEGYTRPVPRPGLQLPTAPGAGVSDEEFMRVFLERMNSGAGSR